MKKSFSIRAITSIVFIVLMLTTVGVNGAIVFSNWFSSTEEVTTKLAEDMNAEIYNQVDILMHVPEHINEVNQKLLKNGIVDLNNETMRESFFVGVLQSHSNEIYSFSYGTENGEYYGARRNENGIIQIMRNNASTGGHSWYYSVNNNMTAGKLVVQAGKFDPRTRDWYKAAKETGKPIFSPLYKHFIMDDLTVSATYPIYSKDGQLQGVLGTHIILSNINNYLKEIVKDKSGFAIIVEKDSGELIANSFGMDNFIKNEDGTFERLNISETQNHAATKAYELYNNTKKRSFELDYGSDNLYVNFTEYHKDGMDWIVISGIPKGLLLTNIIHNMNLTLLLVAIAVLLSILIYYLVTKKLVKPIDSLIKVTEKFSQGDLTQRVTVVRNDEIGRISKAFNKMADTIHMLVNNLETTVMERTVELKETNNALEESKDKLQLILDSTVEAIYGIDIHGNCTFCNASCIELLGYNCQDDLLGKNMHFQIHHSYNDGTPIPINECRIFQAFKEKKGTHVDNEIFWRADGTCFDVEYYSYPQCKDGEVVGAVVTFMDNTNRKRDQEQIKYLSCHDSLTKLLNRSCLENELKKMDTRNNLPLSIIFGDINGLKLTNDVFGHGAGDELIKKSAEILKSVCRSKDIVGRVGGDEFIILLPNTEASEAKKIINRAYDELSKEQISAIRCSMSMGIDTKVTLNQNIERIMENAENQMYKEKTLNRKTVNSDMIKTIITTLHKRSPYEKIHSISVSELCQNIGNAINLPEADIKKLKEAGYLHDIGKIVLDENITNKDGEITEEDIKQKHPVVGYRILNLFDETLDLAEGVYNHHENWNGSGYPKGLKGEEIPQIARIIAVADAFDNLTNDINENAMSKAEALQEIQKLSGVKFDPSIVKIFIDMANKENI